MQDTPAFDPGDPAWLAHRYDRNSDRFTYRYVPREMHGAGPFLTDELIGNRPQALIGRDDALSIARDIAGPVHFLFHSAFCGSTLLTRALDVPGRAMGLSEPVLLNDVTGIRRRGEMQRAELARLLDDCLRLLARRWGDEETVVIKPSNILSGLMAPMMALRPEARALILFAPLRDFLTSVARKGLWCRLWVRELLEGLIREGVDLGLTSTDYFRMSDLQVAAVGWIVQHQRFASLASQYPDRVWTIGSDRLMRSPEAVLAALEHRSMIGGTPNGPHPGIVAFSRHSKSGARFSPEERAKEYSAAWAAHGDEIDKVHEWGLVVAKQAGISLTLPLPLIA